MKNIAITSICICLILISIYSCKKASVAPDNTTLTATLEGKVLTDFANNLVNPNYADIQAKAAILKDAASAFIATPTDANLNVMRTSWKNTRAAWESCEGFLFGPVEDFNYDPTMDDWPVNRVDLDELLASNNQLTIADIDLLGTSLKGFHAIEYVIFGVGSTRKAADITDREKVYLSSLTESLYNTTTQLRNSWDPSAQGNFTLQITTAGSGSTTFATKQAVFLALVGSMADICNEVGDSKMQVPLTAKDSTLDESSFSHNSVSDFTNNIKGVLNAYMCSYGGTSGHSLSELVRSKNASLDATLRGQMEAAIASFGQITTTYEKAIYTQSGQIKAVQKTLVTLKASLEGDLATFVKTNIKD